MKLATSPRAIALGSLLAVSSIAGLARADVAVRRLARAERVSGIRAGILRGYIGQPELSALVELPDGADPTGTGVARVGPHFGVVRAPLMELDALSAAHPTWQVTWSAPLRPLLDKAATWIGAPEFRNTTGLTGKGTVVGVIDTGADVTHPDLRNKDGTTRIAYLIDYSRGPLGKHPDAEALCSAKVSCAVYTGKDLDAAIAAKTSDSIASDGLGHGTHVTSLAAGNGGAEKRYVGIAPEATLIVARAIDASGEISDATVLSAANAIFTLADQLGEPAVLNLSLGSNFGPHDGSSALERGLADLVGDAHPGHAIVVAAGNSAGLFNVTTAFPAPLGVHTDVNVPDDATVRVPIVTPPPPGATDTLSGTVFLWAAFEPGDDISVGVDRRSGSWVPVQHSGDSGTFGTEGVLTATVVNGHLTDLGLGIDDANAAAVIIEGTWPKSETFSLRLEGKGTVSLWVDAIGEIGADSGGVGALFPLSTKEATVTIPAAHPDLIAVGATLNRSNWTDRLGQDIRVSEFGGVRNPPLDSIAFFSSAGPTSDHRMKPDIVAPGAFVAGAMSADADPRVSPASIFGDGGTCTPASDCAVVDRYHAITAGTSMASPIVAGAVALLFEQDATRTSHQILDLLQAGARYPTGLPPLPAQLGAGVLDLPGTLDVENAGKSSVVREPAEGRSFLTLGASFARPDPSWDVPSVLELRDADGHVANGFDPKKLVIDVDQGRITQGPDRAAPGLYRLAVAADPGSGGATLSVEARYGDRLVAAASLPIAVDTGAAREGFTAHGGCAVADLRGTRSGAPFFAAALGLVAWRRARRRRTRE